MKKEIKKLFVTEDVSEDPTGWYLSFLRPAFQGGETIKIDEETAKMILSIPKILEFIERFNKQDKEIDIANLANELTHLV